MKKIFEDVYKIPGDCNVYLILNPVTTLIDTGNPNDKEKIKRELEGIIKLDKIKVVILTHLHYDHCGNVDLFKNSKIYALKEELDDFKKNSENFFFGKVPEETEDILLNKVKPLKEKVNSLKIIKCPGHTKGSVAVLDKNRKLLFSGDTLFYNGIGRTDFENSVPEKMGESLTKLIKIVRNGYLLLPGHDY